MSEPTAGYRVEILGCADERGAWVVHPLRFSTVQEATEYGTDLITQWAAMKNFRVWDIEREAVANAM